MALRLHTGGAASALPLNLIAQAIPRLTRHDLEALTERLIEHLDEQDGDFDSYEGDTEDAFAFSELAEAWRQNAGAGCAITDPGGMAASEDEPDFYYAQPIGGGELGPGCPISDHDHSYY